MNLAKSGSSYTPADADRLLALANNVTQLDAALELHTELKNLKTGVVRFLNPTSGEGVSTLQVTWDEGRQEFNLKANNVMVAMTAGGITTAEERLTTALVDVAQKLTQCARIDREARRATNYPIVVQDEYGFLSRLLSSENNPTNASIAIVHENREEVIGPNFHAQEGEMPKIVSSESSLLHASELKESAVMAATDPTFLKSDKPILVYGFNKTYRKTMMEALEGFHLPKMQTMNDYMKGLNFDTSFGFGDYCDLREEAKAGNLGKKVATIGNDSPCSEVELKKWASCLTRNISKFDFSRKCDSPEKRILFFVKNGDMPKILDIARREKIKIASDIKSAIENGMWDHLLPALEPAFDLIENKENLPVAKLKERYDALMPEVRIMLNIVLCKAFFRKTSKLGLTFAKEQEKTVLFAWNASGTNDDLQNLHDLLEVKQYKLDPPRLRLDVRKKGLRQLAPEATTFSEMRELGRLKQRMMAPNYILIRGISSDPSLAGLKQAIEKSSSVKVSGTEKAGETITPESVFDDYDWITQHYMDQLDSLQQAVDRATEARNQIPETDIVGKQQATARLREAGNQLQAGIARAYEARRIANLPAEERRAVLEAHSFEEMMEAAVQQSFSESRMKEAGSEK